MPTTSSVVPITHRTVPASWNIMQILTVANFNKADAKFGLSCDERTCALSLSKAGGCVSNIHLLLGADPAECGGSCGKQQCFRRHHFPTRGTINGAPLLLWLFLRNHRPTLVGQPSYVQQVHNHTFKYTFALVHATNGNLMHIGSNSKSLGEDFMVTRHSRDGLICFYSEAAFLFISCLFVDVYKTGVSDKNCTAQMMHCNCTQIIF